MAVIQPVLPLRDRQQQNRRLSCTCAARMQRADATSPALMLHVYRYGIKHKARFWGKKSHLPFSYHATDSNAVGPEASAGRQ